MQIKPSLDCLPYIPHLWILLNLFVLCIPKGLFSSFLFPLQCSAKLYDRKEKCCWVECNALWMALRTWNWGVFCLSAKQQQQQSGVIAAASSSFSGYGLWAFHLKGFFPRILPFLLQADCLRENCMRKKEDELPLPLMELFIKEQLSACSGKAPSGWWEQLEIVHLHARNQFHWRFYCPSLYSRKSRRFTKVLSLNVWTSWMPCGYCFKNICKDFKRKVRFFTLSSKGHVFY